MATSVSVLPRRCSEALGSSSRSHVLLSSAVLLVWLALNIGLNFFNKRVFSERIGFTFPLFLTAFHMVRHSRAALRTPRTPAPRHVTTDTHHDRRRPLSQVASFFGGAILIFVFKAAEVRREHWTDYKWRIALLSVLFVLNIACNNASLVHLSLSVNQTIKSCVPLPTMVLSVVFERDAHRRPKTYSCGLVLSLLVVCGGSILAVYGNPEASPFGLVLVLLSTLSVALWSVLSAVVLEPASGLNSINLTWYASVLSGVMLFLMWLGSRELPRTLDYLEDRPSSAAAILAVGSTAAFAYNLVHFALIKVTSAITSTVAGNLKIVLIIIISIIAFEKRVEPINLVGFGVFFAGVIVYSVLTHRARLAAADAVAPTSTFVVQRPQLAPAAAEKATEKTTLINNR